MAGNPENPIGAHRGILAFVSVIIATEAFAVFWISKELSANMIKIFRDMLGPGAQLPFLTKLVLEHGPLIGSSTFVVVAVGFIWMWMRVSTKPGTVFGVAAGGYLILLIVKGILIAALALPTLEIISNLANMSSSTV
ncbi:hypothetical protein OAF27_00710 [Verrucomicrobiales bacterium]|nr:hypothetical protein [Verrucomicrobiales bacterium]